MVVDCFHIQVRKNISCIVMYVSVQHLVEKKKKKTARKNSRYHNIIQDKQMKKKCFKGDKTILCIWLICKFCFCISALVKLKPLKKNRVIEKLKNE